MNFKDKFMEKMNVIAGIVSSNIYISAIKNF